MNRTNVVAGQYAQACVRSAGQCGAEVLDLWTLMQKDGQVRWNIKVTYILHVIPHTNLCVSVCLYYASSGHLSLPL